MNTTITQGSKEFLIVTMDDLLNVVNDLASSTPVFDVYRTNILTGLHIMTNVTATVSGLNLYCLIDTSTGSGLTTPTVPVNGWWAADTYQLYVKFTVSPEVPREGPFAFTVVS